MKPSAECRRPDQAKRQRLPCADVVSGGERMEHGATLAAAHWGAVRGGAPVRCVEPAESTIRRHHRVPRPRHHRPGHAPMAGAAAVLGRAQRCRSRVRPVRVVDRRMVAPPVRRAARDPQPAADRPTRRARARSDTASRALGPRDPQRVVRPVAHGGRFQLPDHGRAHAPTALVVRGRRDDGRVRNDPIESGTDSGAGRDRRLGGGVPHRSRQDRTSPSCSASVRSSRP